MNQEVLVNYFKNIGFIQYKFNDEQLKPIHQEVSNIQMNFDKYEPQTAQNKLAGNIFKEFYIKDCRDHLENLLLLLVSSYDEIFNYTPAINIMNNSYPLTLGPSWVNFQSKGEFNPNHYHSGVLSFVLYIQVPYLIQDEIKNKSGTHSTKNVPGHFEFTYANSLGNIQTETIPVDKTYENTILMFPSMMQHCVYPFLLLMTTELVFLVILKLKYNEYLLSSRRH
jgi:hypothetical protein